MMLNNSRKHTAIFRRDFRGFNILLDCSTPKKIAVLYFHTAETIKFETKMEFKRIRNHTSNQIHAMMVNLSTWSVIRLIGVYYHAQMPVLYQDVSNLSN